jgi:acetyl-CoA synthetase
MIRKAIMKVSQHSDKGQGLASTAQTDHYASLHRQFRWLVPEHFNIAQVCCARWAKQADASKRIAVYVHSTGASAVFHTYSELQQQANRLSNVLAAAGVDRGDRVAIVMPQRFETAVAYMAVLQMGAVAMPLSMLFGPEALAYRLLNSEAVVAVCDEASIDSLVSVRAHCPQLHTVIGVDAAGARANLDYRRALTQASPKFKAVETLAEEAAVLIYTSGTTGNPKGTLIPHRALIGNLTGFVCSQNWFGFDGAANERSEAVFWSPADWAWTGGLMDALLPTLYFGRPIVAFNGRFNPEAAFDLMQQHDVTHTFLFPTALKAMMKAYPEPRKQFKLGLQAIMSAGEAVGDAVFAYCREQLGVTPNEMFGQTEINYIVGNCTRFWPAKPGSMGKGYPGHRVAVIDDDGIECAVGVPGDVALNRFDVHGDPDPIFFLGYWKSETATSAKFTGDWCRTGDMALRDADGYLWYQGRADDMFKAAGYRIGPGEIENCLVKHPAVANAAVVPKPDRERGAVVKAYVVLAPSFIASRAAFTGAITQFDAELVAQLQAHVKDRLAPYEYPKEIEFIDQLPMTTTGKLQRRVLRLQEIERAQKSGATGITRS